MKQECASMFELKIVKLIVIQKKMKLPCKCHILYKYDDALRSFCLTMNNCVLMMDEIGM